MARYISSSVYSLLVSDSERETCYFSRFGLAIPQRWDKKGGINISEKSILYVHKMAIHLKFQTF